MKDGLTKLGDIIEVVNQCKEKIGTNARFDHNSCSIRVELTYASGLYVSPLLTHLKPWYKRECFRFSFEVSLKPS